MGKAPFIKASVNTLALRHAEKRAGIFDCEVSKLVRTTLGHTRILDPKLAELLADFRARLISENSEPRDPNHDLDQRPLEHNEKHAIEKRVQEAMDRPLRHSGL